MILATLWSSVTHAEKCVTPRQLSDDKSHTIQQGLQRSLCLLDRLSVLAFVCPEWLLFITTLFILCTRCNDSFYVSFHYFWITTLYCVILHYSYYNYWRQASHPYALCFSVSCSVSFLLLWNIHCLNFLLLKRCHSFKCKLLIQVLYFQVAFSPIIWRLHLWVLLVLYIFVLMASFDVISTHWYPIISA